MKNITKHNLGEMNMGVTFLIFSASWCGPCRQMAPLLEKLESELTNVVFGKVDIDVSKDLAYEYGVRSIPTMLIIKDGKTIDTLLGSQSVNTIKDKLLALV